MDRFWPVDVFNEYKDLEPKGPYGSTFLLVCLSCGSEYFKPGKEDSSVFLLAGSEKTLFYKFYDDANSLSPESLKVLEAVGSPTLWSGGREYPLTVRTRDGLIRQHCVIRLMPSLWPPALRTEKFSLLGEISEVFVNPQAMTLAQRTAAFQAPEVGMGYSPLWLEKGEHCYRTSYGQYFIPEKMGRPEDFVIPSKRCPDQAPWLSTVPYELFIGRLA
jgi:hypothetical protein